ncbi:MAG: hypothetical protein KUG80_04765 [Gammaproteobacteria bacterium]|nr:hypothetical protein [Gammaproteobacteria bacterium]
MNRIKWGLFSLVLLLSACKPGIQDFSADKPWVLENQAVTLSWSIQNIDENDSSHSVVLSTESGGDLEDLNETVQALGSKTVMLTKTTIFVLTAVNPDGEAVQTLRLPVNVFKVAPEQIIEGQSAQLIWDFETIDATHVTITPDIGQQPLADSQNISPLETTEYQLQLIDGDDTINATVTLEVLPVVQARIIVNPTTGISPLTVRFSPDVNNNNMVIKGYAWDFNGDGTVDRRDNFGAPQTYVYTGKPGDTFEAKLTVTPDNGVPLIITQTITIANQPPTAQVMANVTNGHVPLEVNFTASAQDPQGIDTVTIDFEGDGTIDETQSGNAVTSGFWSFQTTYQNEGVFTAVVRATDTSGGETLVTNNAITVDVNNPLDPIIQLSAIPLSGNVPLTTTLTATAEIFDDSAVNQWYWDLDGNGIFETQGGNGTTDTMSFTYKGVGSYFPAVTVITDSNRMAQASLQVATQSSAVPTLSIPNSSDTINSDTGESATIKVSLPYETQLEVWMEKASGLRIKTLQAPQLTVAGDYSFTWDATDEQDVVVSEGDYYAVLGYTAMGVKQEIDLRTSTGGRLSYYRRTESNPRTFDRLKQPLRINYAVDNPAEISFFWQISFGDRLMTLMEHERMGRGQYSLYWNGEYPNGQKIPNNLNKLMPGIVRYNLPDNVIYVKEIPRIESYTLAATVMVDPRREPIGINLTLSKASTIEIVVADMEKGVDVATRVHRDTPSGVQRILWDGKNNNDQYLAPGDYRIGVRSVDSQGKRSLFWYRTQQINY